MAQKNKTAEKKAEKAGASAPARPQKRIGTHGRVFEGTVTKKFPTRVVVEFERTVYIQKYQRFYKKKTRLHARLPAGMDISVGDYVKVSETRPLSKIIHFIVTEKVRSAGVKQ